MFIRLLDLWRRRLAGKGEAPPPQERLETEPPPRASEARDPDRERKEAD